MESTEVVAGLSYGWAIVLGIVQGLTEFLPVSSSGHLALLQHLGMKAPLPVAFDILLHVATVLIVVSVFWKDVMECWRTRRIVLAYVVLATVPVVVVGLLFQHDLEGLREIPQVVCGALLVTGGMLFVMSRQGETCGMLQETGAVKPLMVGVAQAFALLPGISRSGSTIAAGTMLGLERQEAVRFSFMMMMPAVLGAAGLKMIEAIEDPDLVDGLAVGPCVAGFLAAMISGYVAIRLVIGAVKSRKMVWFAGYCVAVGVAGLIWFAW